MLSAMCDACFVTGSMLRSMWSSTARASPPSSGASASAGRRSTISTRNTTDRRGARDLCDTITYQPGPEPTGAHDRSFGRCRAPARAERQSERSGSSVREVRRGQRSRVPRDALAARAGAKCNGGANIINRKRAGSLSSTFLDLKRRPGAFFRHVRTRASAILSCPRRLTPYRHPLAAPLRYIVEGGSSLAGSIHPSGNKNAALPIIAAALLTDQKVTLENVPRIRDCETLVELMHSLGVSRRVDGAQHARAFEAKVVQPSALDPVLCAKIRASILLAGPAPRALRRRHAPAARRRRHRPPPRRHALPRARAARRDRRARRGVRAEHERASRRRRLSR